MRQRCKKEHSTVEYIAILLHGVDLLKFADVVERGLSKSGVLNLQMLVVLL
jgi:hypothetical protein